VPDNKISFLQGIGIVVLGPRTPDYIINSVRSSTLPYRINPHGLSHRHDPDHEPPRRDGYELAMPNSSGIVTARMNVASDGKMDGMMGGNNL
jgi:hypothetical protein